MKRLDIIVIALVAALSLLPLAFITRQANGRVRVTQHNEILYEGPLGTDARVCAEGCMVTVEGGRAFVSEADCPDGLCLKSGFATSLHPVVCLPNELVVAIIPSEEALDGLTY